MKNEIKILLNQYEQRLSAMHTFLGEIPPDDSLVMITMTKLEIYKTIIDELKNILRYG